MYREVEANVHGHPYARETVKEKKSIIVRDEKFNTKRAGRCRRKENERERFLRLHRRLYPLVVPFSLPFLHSPSLFFAQHL